MTQVGKIIALKEISIARIKEVIQGIRIKSQENLSDRSTFPRVAHRMGSKEDAFCRSNSENPNSSTRVRQLKPRCANLPDFRTLQKARKTQRSAQMEHFHFSALASTPL